MARSLVATCSAIGIRSSFASSMPSRRRFPRSGRAILGNYAAHKHPKVCQWFDRHERVTFHFTPTSCSWLNAVEGSFATLTKRLSNRGVFHSILNLLDSINRFLKEYITQSKPFVWSADPDKIIAAVWRGHQMLDSIYWDPLGSNP